jgi:hypothetical protein
MRRFGMACRLILAGAVLALAGGAARADYNITLNSVSPGEYVTITTGSLQEDTIAGVFNWTNTSGPNSGGHFTTFCIELAQDVNLNGNYTVSSLPLGSAPSGQYALTNQIQTVPNPGSAGAAGGMGDRSAQQLADLFIKYGQTSGAWQNTNAYEAAFQSAIWAIVYNPNADGSNLGLTEGSGSTYFNVGGLDSAATTQANTFLHQVKTDTNNGTLPTLAQAQSELMVYSSPTYQDQIGLNGAEGNPLVTTTPCPSGLCLAIGCVVSLAGYGWRARRLLGPLDGHFGRPTEGGLAT